MLCPQTSLPAATIAIARPIVDKPQQSAHATTQMPALRRGSVGASTETTWCEDASGSGVPVFLASSESTKDTLCDILTQLGPQYKLTTALSTGAMLPPLFLAEERVFRIVGVFANDVDRIVGPVRYTSESAILTVAGFADLDPLGKLEARQAVRWLFEMGWGDRHCNDIHGGVEWEETEEGFRAGFRRLNADRDRKAHMQVREVRVMKAMAIAVVAIRK